MNTKKILSYALIALVVLITISLLAGFLAWIWSKLVLGFVIALVLWLIQKARKKPTKDTFILWRGIVATAILVALDLVTMLFARVGWLIMFALIIGIILWAWDKWIKKS